MKSDATYKRAFNDAVELVGSLSPDTALPAESDLSATLKVSRTTVRKVIDALGREGLIVGSGRDRRRSSSRTPVTKFPVKETLSTSAQVESQFMQWMLRNNAHPGTAINELDLARRFGVATTVVREFLNRFQRFGLIERSPGTGWAFKGFTTRFAVELFEIREMFEMRSALLFAELPDESPSWVHLTELRRRHVDVLADIDNRYQDFPAIDSAFHRLLNSVSPNRFIDNFYDIITMIFHYHYQWNKRDERQRNEVAAREHLAYIDALLSHDPAAVEAACRSHLISARETLLKSTMRQTGF